MSRESKATKEEIQRNRDEAYQNGWGDGYAEGFGKATEAAIAALPARGVGVPTERPDAPAHIVEYTNWRGETARRTIIPIRMWWGSTEWHPQEQWMLTAWDVEKDAPRDFAWQDMRPVQNGATSAALAALAPTDAATQKGGDAHDRRLRSHEASPGVTAGADAAQAREAALREAHKAILAMDTKKDEDLTYNLAVLRAAEKVRRLIGEART